jgi:hypothetical protein
VHGNELAHKYAQKSTTRGNEVVEEPAPRLKSQALSAGKTRILKERERVFNRTLTGMFTRTIDRALPQQHMAKVYDTLSRQDAVILVQLRTGNIRVHHIWNKPTAEVATRDPVDT